MDIITSVICDAAEDYQGKLCILGTFDTLWTDRFPFNHPACSIALRLIMREEDRGRHALQIKLIDVDGKVALKGPRPGGEFELSELEDGQYFYSRNLIFHFQGLPFDRPGHYSFDITVDGVIAARIPLQVCRRLPGEENADEDQDEDEDEDGDGKQDFA